MSGKWHVGQEHGVVPWNRGFDASLNAPAGGFYYADDEKADLCLNGKQLNVHGPELPNGWYTTDLWTDYGIKFMDEGIASKKPFFLYLAYNAPHFPLQFAAGGDRQIPREVQDRMGQAREERHAREIEQGVVDKSWSLSPRPPAVKAWKALRRSSRITSTTSCRSTPRWFSTWTRDVGRLMDALKQRGVNDNTLILFMSDNGGNAESGPNGRLEGDLPGGPKSTVFEGQSWATLSNTPFRRYKHFNHEGGIATPLIVHWPDRIKTPGLRSQVGHVIDLMTTCVDVAGAKYPTELDGNSITPMEGRSLVPAFDDKPIERDALYWEHEGNAAIRVGGWKLVRAGRNGQWELHNMATDRTELHDSSKEEPQKVKELLAMWDAWAQRTHVVPDPAAKAGKKAVKND